MNNKILKLFNNYIVLSIRVVGGHGCEGKMKALLALRRVLLCRAKTNVPECAVGYRFLSLI